MVDEILLNESQQVSTAKEAQEFFDSVFDEKNMYQIENLFLKRLKKNLNDVSLRLNAKRKFYWVLKIEISWRVHMTKK